MTEHPLTPFLRARWDEEETELREMTGGGLVQGYLRHSGDRLLADIAAKRKMLAECEATIRQAVSVGLAETMLSMLAEPYRDHPDYPKDLL